jgi:uncharacterized protein with ParB-like and HNH nuclease domain
MIQPKPSTIGEILTLAAHFVVPKYQRGFAWDTEEAGEFLTDLETETLDGRGLFLGTLIFNVSEQGHDRIIIVDGQQRLTTIFLLLIASRELAKKLNLPGIGHETQKRITVTDPTTAESKGPLLVSSEAIRDVFHEMTKFEWDGSFPQKIGNKSVKRQSRYLRPVYDYFQKCIKDYDKEQLSKLLKAVYDSRVIRIDIDGDEEAFSIFERTNARGTDLEVSDLLKNYLYQQKVADLDDKWRDIISKSNGTIIKMLKYFYVSKKGYVNKSVLYPRLKEYCKTVGGAEKFVEELGQFSDFYNVARKEQNASVIKDYFESVNIKAISTDADKFQRIHLALQALRLFRVSQIYPLVFAATSAVIRTGGSSAKSSAKALIRLLDSMEKYHFINNAVCSRIGNEVEKLYADFSHQFSKTKDFEKTTDDLIASLRKRLASQEEFISRFCEISYTDEFIPLIAYIFDRFNNFTLAPGERVTIFDPQEGVKRKNHNIEHFLPKKPGEPTAIDSSTLAAIDNIGNLLILSFRANSSLGNLPPDKKIQKLEGELSKKTENLVSVKEFVKEYGHQASEWNDKAIQDRARKMAQDAYHKVWKIS